MRKKIIAGNWKMNCTIHETKILLNSLKENFEGMNSSCEVIVCPPFISTYLASEILSDTFIKIGAQNVYFENSGAFTGEISCEMLNSAGCEYVIIGHSERRTLFSETDEDVSKKVSAALESGLKPIVCVGESFSQREEKLTQKFIASQIKSALSMVKIHDKITVAYEPIWAIGTGSAAGVDDAQEVIHHIREVLGELFGESASLEIPILYGGSVNANNIKGFMDQKDIDGALVGGASLFADSFVSIVKAVD